MFDGLMAVSTTTTTGSGLVTLEAHITHVYMLMLMHVRTCTGIRMD